MASWCYVATNPSFPHLVKIGSTERAPADRIRELNTTGVPSPFRLAYAVKVDNGETLERRTHAALKHCRHHHNREFFDTTVQDAVIAIRSEIREHRMTIYAEDDVLKKVQKAVAELERKQKILCAKENLNTVAGRYRNQIAKRQQAILAGPVPYPSAWQAFSDKSLNAIGLLILGGIGAAIVAALPWTIVLAIPAAIYIWSDTVNSNERAKKNSPAYQELERQLSILEKHLRTCLSEADTNPEVNSLVRRFEQDMERLLNPKKQENTVPVIVLSTAPSPAPVTPLPPFRPSRKWLKTGNGLQDLNDRVHIPFSVLRYVAEGSQPGYELTDSKYCEIAWVAESNVQDRGWTRKVSYHCPVCDREHKLDEGLAGARIACACKYDLHLANGRLEVGAAHA